MGNVSKAVERIAQGKSTNGFFGKMRKQSDVELAKIFSPMFKGVFDKNPKLSALRIICWDDEGTVRHEVDFLDGDWEQVKAEGFEIVDVFDQRGKLLHQVLNCAEKAYSNESLLACEDFFDLKERLEEELKPIQKNLEMFWGKNWQVAAFPAEDGPILLKIAYIPS